MKAKSLLALSLGLNLALGGMNFLLAGWRRHQPDLGAPRVQAVTNQFRRTIRIPEASIHIETSPPTPFHWSLVESEDYRLYVHNLRAIGCPERIIQHIIIADVEELYEQRRVAVQRRFPTDGPRITRRQKRDHQILGDARERELATEQETMVSELLGINWNREFHGSMMDKDMMPIVLIILGQIPYEQLPAMLRLLTQAMKAPWKMWETTQSILLPEDRERLANLENDLRQQMIRLVGAPALEEFEARLTVELEYLRKFCPDILLAARELRALARVTAEFESPLANLANNSAHLTEEESKVIEEMKNVRLLELLGADRHELMVRWEQRDFPQLLEWVRKLGLAAPAAISLAEIKQAAREQADQISANRALTDPQRLEALVEVQRQSQAAVTRLVGQRAFTEYKTQFGEWLEELATAPPAGAAGRNP